MSSEKKIDLIDVVTTLAIRKKLIAIIVLVATIIGTVLAFIWPKTYRSEVSFVVTDGSSINLSSGGLLGGLADIKMGSGSISAEQVLILLRSTEIQDKLIHEFNLSEVFGTDIPEGLRKKFDNRVEIEDVRQGGIGFNSIIALKLAYLGDEPQRTYDIVQRYFTSVDSAVRRLNKKNVEDGYLLIKNRLEQNILDLKIAEDSLIAFQSKHGILEVEEQAAAQIGAVANIRTEIVKLEIQISYLKNVSGAESPRVVDLETQKKALERRYDNLMNGGGNDSEEGNNDEFNIFQPIKKMPALFIEYLRRYREVKVQEEIYKILYPQFEQQKLNYEKATSGLMVIDKAVIPTYKYAPKRAYIIIAAFIFGCIISFIKVYFDKWREDNPSDYSRYLEFRSALRFWNANR